MSFSKVYSILPIFTLVWVFLHWAQTLFANVLDCLFSYHILLYVIITGIEFFIEVDLFIYFGYEVSEFCQQLSSQSSKIYNTLWVLFSEHYCCVLDYYRYQSVSMLSPQDYKYQAGPFENRKNTFQLNKSSNNQYNHIQSQNSTSTKFVIKDSYKFSTYTYSTSLLMFLIEICCTFCSTWSE